MSNGTPIRTRQQRYKRYAFLWVVCLLIGLLPNWFAGGHAGLFLLGYVVVSPFVFTVWEIGERQRDRANRRQHMH